MFGLKVCTCLLALAFISTACARESKTHTYSKITLNQLGYLPDSPKVAFYTGLFRSVDSFIVLDAQTDMSVYSNKVNLRTKLDSATGDRLYTLNFTDVDEEGTYRLWIPGLRLLSDSFNITYDVYDQVVQTALKSFYFQRCGTGLTNTGPWLHPVCHLDDAFFYGDPQRQKDVSGGWHDAGDYGKFSVNTAASLAFLLYLYNHRPDGFKDGTLDIPESDNGIPDLLDEARWALDWLLKMQRKDGGVYHKVQKKQWTGEYLPHEDPDPRYIYEVSSTATADMAAVTALAARSFNTFNQEYAARLSAAAQKAWNYLEAHPEMVPEGGFSNPPDVKGGEYGDHRDLDERFWAAVELYRTTGDLKYHQFVNKNLHALISESLPPLSWKNVEVFALQSYLRMEDKQQLSSTREKIKNVLMRAASLILDRIQQNGYRVALELDEYYWGSNSVALGYAFALVQAYEVTGETLYRSAALDQLHYILGRNTFGISFLTGVGSNAVEQPYHQFSNELKVDRPVPGMLVGGPNNHSQLNGESLSKYPGRAYEDNKKNYIVNEVAINYTAPLVYLAGYFSRFKNVTTTISSSVNNNF